MGSASQPARPHSSGYAVTSRGSAAPPTPAAAPGVPSVGKVKRATPHRGSIARSPFVTPGRCRSCCLATSRARPRPVAAGQFVSLRDAEVGSRSRRTRPVAPTVALATSRDQAIHRIPPAPRRRPSVLALARRTRDDSPHNLAATVPSWPLHRLTLTSRKRVMTRHCTWSSRVVGTGVDPVTFRFSDGLRRSMRCYWVSSGLRSTWSGALSGTWR
jgi:hypothetical protein